MTILWLILAVLIWGFVHSLTASLGAKEWLKRIFGDGIMRYYRFGYNAFSALCFLPILWLMAVLPDRVLYQIEAPWLYIMLAGQFLAVVMLVVGVLQTDTLSFIGIRQLFEGTERPSKLVIRGLYRWVRHPLYTAGLLFIWLTPIMSRNSLVVFIAITVYIIVGAFFEERKLAREFGADYEAYQRVTPMLVPGLIFRRNK